MSCVTYCYTYTQASSLWWCSILLFAKLVTFHKFFTSFNYFKNIVPLLMGLPSSLLLEDPLFSYIFHVGPTIFKLAMVDWSLHLSELASGVFWISLFYCFHFLTYYHIFIVPKDGFITTLSHRSETFLPFRSLPVFLLHPFRGNAMVLKSAQDHSHVPGFPRHHTILDLTVEAMYLENYLQILSTTVIAVILSTKYV